MRHHRRESRCAVHSSALIDGARSLQQGSGEAVAAHFSIGMTEPHHRHSSVVHPARQAGGHRQDNVRSVLVDLHQVSSAVAELRVQNVAIIGSSKRAILSVSCVATPQLAFLDGGVGAYVRRRRGRIAAVKRAVDPHRMHDHGELARHRDHGLAV